MGDVNCAKCGELWDYYGVRNGDMEPQEGKRFLRGEGCPCCGFGTYCPSCSGTGQEEHHSYPRCSTCRDGGRILVRQPLPAEVKMGTRTLPERIRTFNCRDGAIQEWWFPCPDCMSEGAEPCCVCKGAGTLTVNEDAALEAAKSELDSSDEEPMGILIRRGLM